MPTFLSVSCCGVPRWRWWLLVGEAILVLTLADLARRLVPFRWLGCAASAGETDIPLPLAQKQLCYRIGQSVERAGRYLPWRTKCLAHALTARTMLAWRGVPSRLRLGVMLKPEDGSLAAHAWLTAGPLCVIGGEALQGHTELTVPAGGAADQRISYRPSDDDPVMTNPRR